MDTLAMSEPIISTKRRRPSLIPAPPSAITGIATSHRQPSPSPVGVPLSTTTVNSSSAAVTTPFLAKPRRSMIPTLSSTLTIANNMLATQQAAVKQTIPKTEQNENDQNQANNNNMQQQQQQQQQPSIQKEITSVKLTEEIFPTLTQSTSIADSAPSPLRRLRAQIAQRQQAAASTSSLQARLEALRAQKQTVVPVAVAAAPIAVVENTITPIVVVSEPIKIESAAAIVAPISSGPITTTIDASAEIDAIGAEISHSSQVEDEEDDVQSIHSETESVFEQDWQENSIEAPVGVASATTPTASILSFTTTAATTKPKPKVSDFLSIASAKKANPFRPTKILQRTPLAPPTNPIRVANSPIVGTGMQTMVEEEVVVDVKSVKKEETKESNVKHEEEETDVTTTTVMLPSATKLSSRHRLSGVTPLTPLQTPLPVARITSRMSVGSASSSSSSSSSSTSTRFLTPSSPPSQSQYINSSDLIIIGSGMNAVELAVELAQKAPEVRITVLDSGVQIIEEEAAAAATAAENQVEKKQHLSQLSYFNRRCFVSMKKKLMEMSSTVLSSSAVSSSASLIREYDSHTVESWMNSSKINNVIKNELTRLVRQTFSCEPNEMSMLFFLMKLEKVFGEEKKKSELIDSSILPSNITIHYSHTVSSIQTLPSLIDSVSQHQLIEIHTTNGRIFQARQCLFSNDSPMRRKNIEFTPVLSAVQSRMIERVVTCEGSSSKHFYPPGVLSQYLLNKDGVAVKDESSIHFLDSFTNSSKSTIIDGVLKSLGGVMDEKKEIVETTEVANDIIAIPSSSSTSRTRSLINILSTTFFILLLLGFMSLIGYSTLLTEEQQAVVVEEVQQQFEVVVWNEVQLSMDSAWNTILAEPSVVELVHYSSETFSSLSTQWQESGISEKIREVAQFAIEEIIKFDAEFSPVIVDAIASYTTMFESVDA